MRDIIDIILESENDWLADLDDVVWRTNEYAIRVDDIYDARFIALFYNKNGKRVKVGEISTRGHTIDDVRYTGISGAHIDSSHKRKGLGKQMYRELLKHISSAGIASYLPDRTNKRAVPAIYRALGGVEDGDWAIIPKTPMPI